MCGGVVWCRPEAYRLQFGSVDGGRKRTRVCVLRRSDSRYVLDGKKSRPTTLGVARDGRRATLVPSRLFGVFSLFALKRISLHAAAPPFPDL